MLNCAFIFKELHTRIVLSYEQLTTPDLSHIIHFRRPECPTHSAHSTGPDISFLSRAIFGTSNKKHLLKKKDERRYLHRIILPPVNRKLTQTPCIPSVTIVILPYLLTNSKRLL